MKYVAIIFLTYEVFKLIRLRSTVQFFIGLKHNKLIVSETYHIFANVAYLIFTIVLLFNYPVYGLILLGISGIVWFLETVQNDKAYSAIVISDGLASMTILTTFILKG